MKVRVTEADPTLPHQIRLAINKHNSAETLVFCNCSPVKLGTTSNKGDVWAIYNRTELHDSSTVPFVPRAHHDQNAKVYEIE